MSVIYFQTVTIRGFHADQKTISEQIGLSSGVVKVETAIKGVNFEMNNPNANTTITKMKAKAECLGANQVSVEGTLDFHSETEGFGEMELLLIAEVE